MKLNVDDVIIVEVTEVSYQGLGVYRKNDFPIFIQGLFTGEKGKIRITKVNSKFAFAILEKLLVKNEEHRLFFDDSNVLKTGIAPLWGMSYPYQISFKEEYLRKLISWNLKFPDEIVNNFVSNDSEIGNRNKISVPLILKNGKLVKAGYIFLTNKKIQIDKHPLIKPKTEKIIDDIIEVINHIHYVNKNTSDLKNIVKLTCRIGKNGKMIFILSILNKHIFESFEIIDFIESKTEIVQFWFENIRKENSYYKNIFKKEEFFQEMDDLNFRLRPISFFQTDTIEFLKIVEVARKFFNDWNINKIIDFYCGVGSLGMLIGKKDTEIIGIDIVTESIEDAKYNAEINGFTNTKYHTGDAFTLMKRRDMDFSKFVILLDPPRAGLNSLFINLLIEKEAKRIIYISCDPRTLIRDLKIFKEHKYKIKYIQGFDLFPQTSHIEVITIIEK